MILKYIEAAIKKAEYKKIDDGSWFGEIPELKGVWANGNSVEECRNELLEVLEEWLLLKIKTVKFYYHWFLLRTPILGKMARNVNMANFTRTLGLL